jgi:hypothetical protein
LVLTEHKYNIFIKIGDPIQNDTQLQIFSKQKFIESLEICNGVSSSAGILAMDLFSTTYFDENIFLVLSKGQTFRKLSAFEDPEQF